jgi:FixJ family two-component response regulator
MPLVVMVDDDPLFIKGIAIVLGLAGYEVRAFLSLQEGLDYFATETAAVLIADLNLGDGSGWDLIEFVRERRPEVGVVVVSGYYDALADENARRFGVAVLTKPFDTDDLIEVIRGLTEEPRAPGG